MRLCFFFPICFYFFLYCFMDFSNYFQIVGNGQDQNLAAVEFGDGAGVPVVVQHGGENEVGLGAVNHVWLNAEQEVICVRICRCMSRCFVSGILFVFFFFSRRKWMKFLGLKMEEFL